MTRVLSLLFLFYIQALIIMPCIDVPQQGSTDNVEVADNKSHDHHEENDHCSPFCTCDCCVSPALHNFIAVKKSINITVPYLYQEYHFLLTSSPFVAIWQPPQLV